MCSCTFSYSSTTRGYSTFIDMLSVVGKFQLIGTKHHLLPLLLSSSLLVCNSCLLSDVHGGSDHPHGNFVYFVKESANVTTMKRFLILATILILGKFVTESAEIKLIKFSWTLTSGREITNLTICTNTTLGTDDDLYKFLLSYRTDKGDVETTYEAGERSEIDPTCVSFLSSPGHKFGEVYVTYHLTVADMKDDSETVVYFGAAHFAVQTDALSMNCSSPFPLYYRIEAGAGAVFKDCLIAGDNVCYRDGSTGVALADMDICYTDSEGLPTGVEICQKGLEVNGALEHDNALQINYLAYGEEDSKTATLKLLLKTGEISEVIVAAGNDTTTAVISMCSYTADGTCTINSFTPKNTLYSVCSLATNEDSKSFISVDTIQDFDVFIYADTGVLLDFGFANANPEMWYTATLLNAAEGDPEVDSVKIDCTMVEPTHNCYGFLVVDGLETKDSYLEVSYYRKIGDRKFNTKKIGDRKSNTVIVPHVTPTPTEPPRPKIN